MSTSPLDAHLEIFAVKRGNRYQDLSDHWFTVNQKNYVENMIIDKTLTLKVFLDRHNIAHKKTTINDWVKSVKEGRKIYEFGGRPSLLDEESKEEIKKWTKIGGDSGNTMLSPTHTQLQKKVRLEACESAKRKGYWVYDSTPDPKTMRKIEKEVEIMQKRKNRCKCSN